MLVFPSIDPSFAFVYHSLKKYLISQILMKIFGNWLTQDLEMTIPLIQSGR